MNIVALHFFFRLKQIFREQAYVVSTLIFPALFFLIFALPNATTPERAKLLLGSFSAFAILAVVVLQFGVQLSTEIRSPWNQYLRTLPVSQRKLFSADMLRAFVMGSLSVFVVICTVLVSTDVSLSAADVFGLWILQLILAIPFSVFAAGLAFWIRPEAALPIFNLIYILGSFAGGLWLPPNALPEKIRALSVYLPTRHMGEVTWAFLLNNPFPRVEAALLALFSAFSLIFYLVSWRSYKKSPHSNS